MFETVSPELFTRRNRSVFYETLPVSLAIHLLVVGYFAGAGFMRIAFPDSPPHLAFAYQISLEPPPPPPPPPAAARAAQPAQPVRAAELPLDKIVAPTVIPDTIPVVEPMPLVADEIAPIATAGQDGGVAGGDEKAGVKGGVVEGQPRGILGGVLLDDGRVHFTRDVPLPLLVEHQEYPVFPESARMKGWEDSVLVHYVIDTTGSVRDLVILDHAEHKEFDEAALTAIKGWRFRPLLVDGQPTEAVHELTVYFKLR